MAERPILFSGPMVRAILDGRKTQTRRVARPQPGDDPRDDGYMSTLLARCPYGQPGDWLWVRETFVGAGNLGILYAADCPRGTESGVEGGWRPSIFMPRWASRLTLEITEVRVQRVQEISEADAIAEGALHTNDECSSRLRWPQRNFAAIWDSLNAKRGHGWDTNPWVWAITFRAERGPDAGRGEG